MQDSIEPSHLVVKATADVILNPEGHMTSNTTADINQRQIRLAQSKNEPGIDNISAGREDLDQGW